MICPVCNTESEPEGGLCENEHHTIVFECPSAGCKVGRFTFRVEL